MRPTSTAPLPPPHPDQVQYALAELWASGPLPLEKPRVTKSQMLMIPAAFAVGVAVTLVGPRNAAAQQSDPGEAFYQKQIADDVRAIRRSAENMEIHLGFIAASQR
jgi:hypothetical protein